MKLINCPECNDVVNLIDEFPRLCKCRKCSGKYLDDHITAVVSKDAIVCGIDNNGFKMAKDCAIYYKDEPQRVDFFFTGWIPTKPGEVIVVDSYEDVLDYEYHVKKPSYVSTSPTKF